MIMSVLKWNWFRTNGGRPSAASPRDRGRRRVRGRLRSLDRLEDRALLSGVYTVNSLGDTGAGLGQSGDLRYCITRADNNPGSTIRFGVTGTIALKTSLPDVGANLNIVGPGAGKLTVRLNPSQVTPKGILTIAPRVSASLSGLTLSGGNTAKGGAIDNFGTLSVSNATFSGNTANRGAGIANNAGAVLHVSGSRFIGDTGSYAGGGIDNIGGAVTVSGSAFSLDVATDPGGGFGAGIANESGAMTVTGSTFSGGFASGGGGGIYNGGGKLSASGDTFANNHVLFGGGIDL
jgi:hypothetical protein